MEVTALVAVATFGSGLLGTFAGVISAWTINRVTVRHHSQQINDQITACASWRNTCMARRDVEHRDMRESATAIHRDVERLRAELAATNANLARVTQQLEDFVEFWKKNGNGGKHA